MHDRLEQPALGQVLIEKRVARLHDAVGGYASPLEAGRQFVFVEAGGPGLDGGVDGLPVGAAALGGPESAASRGSLAHLPAQGTPGPVALHGDGDPVVFALAAVDALGREVPVAVAETVRFDPEGGIGHGVPDEQRDRLHHREVDEPAAAGALALFEGSEQGEGGEPPTKLVRKDSAADPDRRLWVLADEAVHAAGRFGARAEGRVGTPRPGRPESRELKRDDRRVDAREHVVAKAEPLHHAADEVRTDDVGVADELLRNGQPLGGLEVDAYAGLREVHAIDDPDVEAVAPGADHAHDFGAEFGQRARPGGEGIGEFEGEDTDALERQVRAACRPAGSFHGGPESTRA